MATQRPGQPPEWVGFSLKTIAWVLIGIVLLIWYIKIILFGDNSLQTLYRLKEEKSALLHQRDRLKEANQKLQKEYFELLQLENDQDNF
jgi:cell division protein FtsB